MTLLPDTGRAPAPETQHRQPSAAPAPPPRALGSLFHHVLAPAAAGATVAALSSGSGAAYEAGMVAFLTFFCGAFATDREGRWAALLQFMAMVSKVSAALLGAVLLAITELVTGMPGLGVVPIAAAAVVSSAVTVLGGALETRVRTSEHSVRMAVIGSQHAATSLNRELALARVTRYRVVGRIAMPGDEVSPDDEVVTIGDLSQLSDLVREHNIHLLIMTGEVPRLTVFNEVAATCLQLPVRLWELSGFYEDVFGHVPVAEINASWFQYLMHPKYRSTPPSSKRVLDVAIALVVATLSLPLMLLIGLLIRRDGGPALFRQTRIGEGGRPFTLYKLRTMTVGAGAAAQWASLDDPRITAIGRLLRKTHLDEFPQVINVLRGEMSLVGPRPEQPEFVKRLEHLVPYYTRRHLVKPGITGWAQVRCGYAGSDVGSAWKLCHDLYYLKHRSATFDLVILGETLRTLIADRQYAVEPRSVNFILGADRLPAEAIAGGP